MSATSLTITETGGATVSFTLTSATRVRTKAAAATLANVTAGADVIVVSEQIERRLAGPGDRDRAARGDPGREPGPLELSRPRGR